MQQKEFFDTEELAQFLNVHPNSIVKWRAQNRLPGAVKVGKVWRYRINEIEKRLLTGSLLLPTGKKCH